MAAVIDFKPKMLGIVCNWCCYGGADLAGVSRFQYPPHIRLMRVMCSGRVDMKHIFRAFSNGADAVFIGGCHLSDCHYITEGNYDALRMVLLAKKILKTIGVNPDRLRLEWVSAGEGIRFANIMNEFAAQIKEIGPLGVSEGIDPVNLKRSFGAVTRIIPYIRGVDNQRLRVSFPEEEQYVQYYDSPELNGLYQELIANKLAISQIVSLLGEKPLSTSEIAFALNLTPSEVSKHLVTGARMKYVKYDEVSKSYCIA